MDANKEQDIVRLIETECAKLSNPNRNTVQVGSCPSVIVILGQFEEDFLNGIENAYQGVLGNMNAPILLKLPSEDEAGRFVSYMTEIIDGLMERKLLKPGENMTVSVSFVAQMDAEVMASPDLIPILDKGLTKISQRNILLQGWKFFGIFDNEKTIENGSEYKRQFQSVHEGLQAGIWNEVFHMERDKFLSEIVAKAISFEVLRDGKNTYFDEKQYEWKFLWFTMTKLPQHFLCNILLELCRGQKVNWYLLGDSIKQTELQGVRDKLLECVSERIKADWPLLMNGTLFEACMPHAITHAGNMFIGVTHTARPVSDEYKKKALAGCLEDMKKQISTETLINQVLMPSLMCLHFIDYEGIQKEDIGNLISRIVRDKREVLSRSSGIYDFRNARREMEILLLERIGKEEVIEKCLRNLLSKLDENEELLQRVKDNDFGLKQKNLILNLDFQVPLMIDLGETLALLTREYPAQLRGLVQNEKLVSNFLSDFIANTDKVAMQQNGFLAGVRRAASGGSQSGILLTALSRNVDLTSVQHLAYSLEDVPNCLNGVVLCLSYTKWNSEEGLVKYHE